MIRFVTVVVCLALVMLVWSPPVQAQSQTTPPSSTQSAGVFGARSDDERPSTTTFLGDTGIWYVPTADILRTLNLDIEGHTCNIGTVEYNVALAERRASAVRDYFMNRGIAASRLRTSSYGEENPEHANAHEDTRRLNRRVALVVRLQP